MWKARDRGPCRPLYQPQVFFRWETARCGRKILCKVIVLLSFWANCNLSEDQFQDLQGRVALGTLGRGELGSHLVRRSGLVDLLGSQWHHGA